MDDAVQRLLARERIRDTIDRLAWSADALRLDDLAGCYCPDGVLAIRGREPVRGREAIAAFIGGVGAPTEARLPEGPRGPEEPGGRTLSIVRHSVTNLRFVELTATEARVESYFTVLTDLGLDHAGRYRDELVPVGEEWLIRHRSVSTDWRAPDSTMAPPESVR